MTTLLLAMQTRLTAVLIAATVANERSSVAVTLRGGDPTATYRYVPSWNPASPRVAVRAQR
jgi:hypothetical protein